eukprot:TRINITY_DN1810_c0_g1_i2.p1 TRINITY_DN1810_c0_g1~~TRINITY_DN1810_c0_g1_i2.p1  ORF type:complete len:105 (+),score=14.42 TRINITY_DN1810_c0_g1_i2:200-514(+)
MPMDNISWRADEARQQIVTNIVNTFQRHMPQTGLDGMQELTKIAIRFEEKIFNTAQNQHDYLRKISLKMLSLETRALNSNHFQYGTNQQPLEHGCDNAATTDEK